MTDTNVENLIINKFLELTSLEAVPKCVKYFDDNKESDTTLESFEAFMPDYENSDYGDIRIINAPALPVLPNFEEDNPETGLPWTEAEKEQAVAKYNQEKVVYDTFFDNRAKIEGPCLTLLITWFRDTYVNYYDTPDGNAEDDALYDAIKRTIPELTTIKRTIKIYDENGEKKDLLVFPNVAFPNMEFIRPTNELGDNTFWYELYFIPAPPNQVELGTQGRSRWVGIMQINVCIPKTWGTEELYARYDEIAKLFRSGLILQDKVMIDEEEKPYSVRIIRTYRSTAVDDDDFYCLPVTIEWRSDLYR